MGLDTKTYRVTDRKSQCDFDFDFEVSSVEREFWACEDKTWLV
jgi:hypothetical protein